MEKEPVPTSKPSPGRRLFLFFRKVLLWSALLWVLNLVFTKAGWDTWEKFSDKSTRFVNDIAGRAMLLSPLALWVDLKKDKYISIPDPDAVTVPEHTVRERSPFSFQDSIDKVVPAYHPNITHKVTIKEKIISWGRSFWFKPGTDDPHWFGRILLIATIIFAFLAKEPRNSTNRSNWITRFFMILVTLPILLLLLYLLLKLLVVIVGAIVALFSSIMAFGGFAGYVVEELRSEAADHSKKTILSVIFPFLFKKK